MYLVMCGISGLLVDTFTTRADASGYAAAINKITRRTGDKQYYVREK